MKRTILVLMVATLFVSCEKEAESVESTNIVGTEWVGEVSGITATLNFISETVMRMEYQGISVPSTYIYNPELKAGIIEDDNGTGSFRITGNTLILETDGMKYTFKKK